MRNDPDLYERNALDWWNPTAPAFRSLHRIHGLRVRILREWLGPYLPKSIVLDLGCGGGLLSVPLSQMGARVVGVDRSRASLRQAQEHGGTETRWLAADLIELPLQDRCADIVILADVVEHVKARGQLLSEAARVLRRGGFLYINTVNRTRKARFLAVAVAETVRLIPPGTHDPELFVDPDVLRSEAEARGLVCLRLLGERPKLLSTIASWAIELEPCDDLSVGYSALFVKEAP
ncbi:MAG: 3-demethylubiquinone-9 3-O-methyltransferase [Planctomycetes bacterium]|nr:3-demethylubiquinone-9 3-O-methyltransferase [Planctomycetota bacterium]